MVPEFTIVARPEGDKPALIQRRRFKEGLFSINGLDRAKYQLIIAAPKFVGVRLDIDFRKNANPTNFRIIVLHKLRNERPLQVSSTETVPLKAIEEIPSAAKVNYESGVEFHREGQLDQALEHFSHAIRLYPNYVRALSDTGTVYLLLNRPDAAIAFLRRALFLDSTNPLIRLNMAAALLLKQDYDGAIKLLNGVLKDVRDKSLPHLYLARAYYLQRKFAVAEEMLRSALEEDPSSLDGWLLMVNMALERKQYDVAREGLTIMRETMNNRRFSQFIDEQLATMVAVNQ